MTKEQQKAYYDELFSSDNNSNNSVSPKSKAFDKIAEQFYFGNFGKLSKSDIEVLLFSIFIEEILDKDEEHYEKYSDYTLSKQLGIPQSKVSNLKVKKELQYPYKNFKWQDSLLRISNRAIFENGKIMLYVQDKNLYYEVKNAIETSGGFVEIQLTPNLLQVRPEWFLDLMISISEEDTRKDLRKKILKQMKQNNEDVDVLSTAPIGTMIKDKSIDLIFTIIEESLPFFGGTVRKIAEMIYNTIKIKLEE